MPGLVYDGKMYVQTIAVEIFLARKFNLLGNNENDEYEIISLLASKDDLYKKIFK